jgi:uncharacterized protein YdhG (YjbR/CyaY superfamily)
MTKHEPTKSQDVQRAEDLERVNDYIDSFPPDVRTRLEQVRRTIRKVAPGAREAMSYGIPTFKGYGNIIHFAAFAHHISVYPAPRGVEAFAKALAAHEGGKGTAQFPFSAPLPLKLIERIAKFRVAEDAARGAKKRQPKAAKTPRRATR